MSLEQQGPSWVRGRASELGGGSFFQLSRKNHGYSSRENTCPREDAPSDCDRAFRINREASRESRNPQRQVLMLDLLLCFILHVNLVVETWPLANHSPFIPPTRIIQLSAMNDIMRSIRIVFMLYGLSVL